MRPIALTTSLLLSAALAASVVVGPTGCERSQSPGAPADVEQAEASSASTAATANGAGAVKTEAAPKPASAAEPKQVATAEPPAEGEPQEDEAAEPPPGQRVVAFTSRGPLLVELDVAIGGQPQQAVADAVLDEALRVARGDDKRGAVDWERLLANERIAAGDFGNTPLRGPADVRRIEQQYDTNRNHRVDRNELAALVSQDNAGGRLFSVAQAIDRRGADDQASSVLALLDDNEDGRLSDEEMAAAGKRLRASDANDDELVTLADVRRGLEGEPSYERQSIAPPRQLVELNKLEIESIYYELCELYDVGEGLDRAALALVPSWLDALDGDGNGRIDQEELLGLMEIAADVRLAVDFEPRESAGGAAALRLKSLGPNPNGKAKTVEAGGRVAVEMPGLVIDFSLVDGAGGSSPAAAAADRLKAFDADKSGALEGDEAAGLAKSLEVDVTAIDADGDGKLAREEIETALARRRSFSSVQVQVGTSPLDDGLFAWLDTSGDGRLTARELDTAGGRLGELDANHDGLVTSAEIPERLAVVVYRGARMPGAMGADGALPAAAP